MAYADKREYAYWLDQSGNNHDWTSTHLTESDISVDSPTNNFCTWNPLTKGAYALAWTEGNLKVNSSADWSGTLGTFAVTSGKWYWEISEGDQTDAEQSVHIGVVVDDVEQDHQTFQALSGSVAYQANGNLRVDGSASGVGTYATYYTTDIIGVALDLDSGTNTVKFFKNNVLQGTTNLPSSFTGKAVVPFVSAYQHYIMANFGQDSSFAGHKSAQGNQDGNEVGDFYYTPPSGYLALCTSNLAAATVTPSEHFGVVTYTGDGNSTQAITTDFQPDLVWVKNRNSGNQATINDVLRGFAAANTMRPNETDNESTFGSNAATYGFTDDVSSTSITVNKGSGTGDYVNRSSYTYAAWLWKAGGSGSSNTNGTINTTATSANTDAGFSISTYTGTGSNATIGHGLTKAPEVVIVKERAADAGHWYVWHTGFANTHGMYLNASTGITESDTYWNDTSPTSTVFSIGTNSDINGNTNTYVAYCFHSVDGYSKFGKYIGNNNNDGPFIYLGFRPKYFMLKASSTTDSWLIYDSAREPYNEDANADLMLRADNDAAESEYGNLDFCSNGVKIRISASAMNEAHTYIYLAFAETPFKYANAR